MSTQNLFGSFRRLKDFSLDPSNLFKTKAELELYINTDKTAYAGQIVAVYNEEENNGIYLICGEKGNFSLLKTADVSDISSLNNSKDELLKNVSELRTSISDVDSKIDIAETNLNEKIDGNTTLINTTSETLSGRIDDVSNIISDINEKLTKDISDVATNAAENLNSAVIGINETISETNEKIFKNTDSIETFERKLAILESAYKTADISVEEKVNTNKTNIETNTSNIETILRNIKNIESAQGNVDAIVASHTEEIAKINEDVKDIYTELENITSFEYEVIDTLERLDNLSDEDKQRKGYIYFVLEDENEYMFIQYTDGIRRQCLGHRTVDITKYYTKDEVLNILLSYVTNTKLEEILSEYEKITESDEKLNIYKTEVANNFTNLTSKIDDEVDALESAMNLLISKTDAMKYTNNAIEDLTNGDVKTNKDNITLLQSRMGDIESENSIEKIIEKNTSDILSNYKLIQENKNNIAANVEDIDKLQAKVNVNIEQHLSLIDSNISDLSDNINNIDSNINTKIKILEDGQVTTNKNNIASLNARMNATDKNISDFLTIKEGYERQIVINKENIREALKAIGDTKQLDTNVIINGEVKKDTLIAKIKRLEDSDGTLETRIIALETGIDPEDSTGTSTNIFSQLKDMRDQVGINKENISTAQKDIDSLDLAINNLKQTINNLADSSLITDINNNIDVIEQDITNLEERVSESEGKINVLETSNVRLKNQIQDLEGEKKSIVTRLSNIETTLNRIVTSIDIGTDGSLSPDQENKIPTVKAVVDLLSQYSFNPENPSLPEDNISDGTPGPNGSFLIDDFNIVEDEEGRGIRLLGIQIDTENKQLNIR